VDENNQLKRANGARRRVPQAFSRIHQFPDSLGDLAESSPQGMFRMLDMGCGVKLQRGHVMHKM